MAQRVVTADRQHLVSKRRNTIKSLLAGIAASTIGTQLKPTGRALVLVTSSGAQPSDAYTDWTFPTRVPSFVAAYYERWLPYSEKDEVFNLERCYFHLYALRGPDRRREEVVALHCDPAPLDVGEMSEYKMATHLHVKAARYPIGAAHICLDIGRFSEVCKSLSGVTAAMERGLKLIEEEILLHADALQLTA